jgi:hypothetical protein
MTQSRILVSLAAGYMTLDVLQPTRAMGIGPAWQRWLAYLQGQAAPNERVVYSITVQGNTSMQGLAILFQKSLDALKKSQFAALAGSPVEVVLGPSLSHVGVLDMVTNDAAKLTETDKGSFVDAWILQTWAVPPSECLVCYVPVNRSGRYLVTCIERYIVDAIETLCAQESLQLRSCKPALVNHLATLVNNKSLRSPSPLADEDTAQAMGFGVFEERGINNRRTHMVQFLVFQGAQPLSATRMWLPVVEGVDEDLQVESVLKRLQAQYQCAGAQPVIRVRWPLEVKGVVKP